MLTSIWLVIFIFEECLRWCRKWEDACRNSVGKIALILLLHLSVVHVNVMQRKFFINVTGAHRTVFLRISYSSSSTFPSYLAVFALSCVPVINQLLYVIIVCQVWHWHGNVIGSKTSALNLEPESALKSEYWIEMIKQLISKPLNP